MLVVGTAPAHAFDVERVPRSLKDQATVFQRAQVPDSQWQRATPEGALATRTPATQFGRAAAPDTVFRTAEIPPERLDATRALLTELKARQTDERAIVVELPADVLFDFDQDRLRPDARASLDRAAELLRGYPDAPVRIHGHTDAKGSASYNDRLSLRRAQAVAQALAAETGRRFTAQGYGKTRPVAANTRPDGSDDPEGRQRNRRVEIVIEPTAGAAAASAGAAAGSRR